MQRPSKIVLLAPGPPPVHGAALMVDRLLKCQVAQEVGISHINAVYSRELSDLTGSSIRKFFLLLVYLWKLMMNRFRTGARIMILTPGCYVNVFLKDALFIWFSSLVLRQKTIGWIHMDYRVLEYHNQGPITKWIIRNTFRRLDGIVVLGQTLRSYYPDFLDSNRIHVIPNGIDAPMPLAAVGEASGRRLRVLFLSHMKVAKGWQDFLACARLVCKNLPNVEFVMRGDIHGVCLRDIQAEIDLGDFGGRIRYEGPAFGEEKWSAFRDADVFCFSSHHEAFPLVVLEAMSQGLPIVATDVGSVKDALDDGLGGFVVPVRDRWNMTQRLLQLLDSPGLRQQFGEHNRQRFLANFTTTQFEANWGVMLKQLSA
jgi:glycosyltransferase involved in cell wall biosynthesis